MLGSNDAEAEIERTAIQLGMERRLHEASLDGRRRVMLAFVLMINGYSMRFWRNHEARDRGGGVCEQGIEVLVSDGWEMQQLDRSRKKEIHHRMACRAQE